MGDMPERALKKLVSADWSLKNSISEISLMLYVEERSSLHISLYKKVLR